MFFLGLSVYLFFTSFLMALCDTATAFGGAILFYVAWSPVVAMYSPQIQLLLGDNDFRAINAILAIRTIVIGPYMIFVSRSGFRRKIFLHCCIPGLLSAVAGTVVLMKMEADPLRLGLGLFLLLCVVIYIVCLQRSGPLQFVTALTQAQYLSLSLCAVVAGLMGGMFGAPGPPFMLYLMGTHLDKSLFRGSYSPFNQLLNVFKAFIMWYYGQIDVTEWRMWVIVGGMCLFAVPGIYAGNIVHMVASPQTYAWLLACLLTMGAVIIMKAPPFLVYVAAGICTVVFTAKLWYKKYQESRGSQTREDKKFDR